MKRIWIEYEGRPVPWARTNMLGSRHVTPKKQRLHRRQLAKAMRQAAGKTVLEGPVSLFVKFDYERNVTQIQVWELQGFSARTKAPDIDNLVKQVMEALEDAGVVANDQQVAHVEAEKIGHKPKAKPKGKTE